jgi:hypothetical protein
VNIPTSWPGDADGDVLRRLQARAFDFSSKHEIEFNVDFEEWPPHPNAIAWLESKYSSVEVRQPEAGFSGYIQFKVLAKLSYELVMQTQCEATLGTEEYGGVCESWGVLQQAP